MQQFILEEQLEEFCDEDRREYEDVVELEKGIHSGHVASASSEFE